MAFKFFLEAPQASAGETGHVAATVTTKRWGLSELKLGMMFLRGMLKSGLTMADCLAQMARLQPQRADFWKGAHRHTKNGKSFSSYLRPYWDATIVTPIEIAERSGSLESVLIGIENTLQQQIDTRKLLHGLWYPALATVGGISAFVFFTVWVIPSLSKGQRFQNGQIPGIISFSNAVSALIQEYGLLLLGALVFALGSAVWKWKTSSAFRASCHRIIDKLPFAGRSMRWLFYSIWANYVSIMFQAGIDPKTTLMVTKSVLPPHLQPSVDLVTLNLHLGYDRSTTPTAPDDARHYFPIHIVNAFLMTDRTGMGDEQFAIARDTLYEPAQELLMRTIKTSTNVATVLAGVFAMTPMGMYFGGYVSALSMIH